MAARMSQPEAAKAPPPEPAPANPESVERARRTAAHLVAAAARQLHPGAKLGTYGLTEDGFWVDVRFPQPITDADLPKIEKLAGKIASSNRPVEVVDAPHAEAVTALAGEPFALERAQEAGATVPLIRWEGFVDVAQPGANSNKTIAGKHLKLLSHGGSYWKGDAKREALTRIHGTAWPTKEHLEHHVWKLEEARKRDHRVLGKQLDLFMWHPVAPGAPFWLPKGLTVYHVLAQKMREWLLRSGYVEVRTPILFEKTLWETSGHWGKYQDNMFLVPENGEPKFSLKPMNCPSHMLVYASRKRSFRELPLRLHDQGILHRNEISGALGGLTRLRQFSQDDAHIFLSEEMIEDEVTRLLAMVDRLYGQVFDFHYEVKLSTKPENALGSDEFWAKAEGALAKALEKNGKPFAINAGDGAFYGPKIDFDVTDAIGRKWQVATIQLDFNMPQRFGLKYVASDGSEKQPVVVHRAIYGSIERFLGILLEHYAGDLPVWLAPVQAKVLSVSDKSAAYAREVGSELRAAGLRVEVNDSDETINAKIRDGELEKVPYLLVVGQKEAGAGLVAVRSRVKGDEGATTRASFIERIRKEAEMTY